MKPIYLASWLHRSQPCNFWPYHVAHNRNWAHLL